MRKNRARTFVKILVIGLFGLSILRESKFDFNGFGGFNGFSIVQRVFAVTYAPGTRCPEPNDERLAVICGTVRSSMPRKETITMGDEIKEVVAEGMPLAGVSVYLYECDPASPTCKKNGNLVHPFSSTWTTNESGRFYITTRKLGGYKRRYLVFACYGKIANIKIVPSYKDVELTEYLNCPNNGTYIAPPNALSYIDRSSQVSNDMIAKDESGEKLTMEVSYVPSGENNTEMATAVGLNTPPKATLNFDLNLAGADARFIKEESPLVDLANQEGADKGAFWYKDCQLKYADNPNVKRLCMGELKEDIYEAYTSSGGTSATKSVIVNGNIDDYETALYNDPLYVVQTKLPNIPPKSSILMYKEFTPRQDLVEYIQDPTSAAQFLHTHFGNCVGQVFIRHYKENKTDDYIDCEEFRKCNELYSEDDTDVRNMQNSNGYAKMLSIPTITQKVYEEEIDKGNIICKKDGEEIRIYEIQPDWDISNGSSFKLDKRYFNFEMVYYYGIRGSTGKYGMAFYSKNDSFGASAGMENKTPFTAFAEAADVPMRGGTSVIFTNGGKNNNNSIVSAIGLASKAFSDEVMTDIFTLPYEDPANNFLGTRFYDKGNSGGGSHRTLSAINRNVSRINFSNEENFYSDNDFKGNPDHYPNTDFGTILTNLYNSISSSYWTTPEKTAKEDIDNKGKRTATSGLFFTTAAKNRMYSLNATGDLSELPGISRVNIIGKDFYDGILTASYGSGKVTISSIINSAINIASKFLSSFFGKDGDDVGKSFLDRKNGAKLRNPEVRDDMTVKFDLSEENFMDKFPLPTPYGPKNQITTTIPNQYGAYLKNWLDPEDWGEHACYPWHYTEFAKSCGTYKEYLGISRTCRVDICKEGKVTLTWNCTATENIDGTYNVEQSDEPSIDVNITTKNCDSATPTDRRICANKQTSCLKEDGGKKGGGRDRNKDESTAACIANDDEGIYWAEIEAKKNNPPACPDLQEILDAGGSKGVSSSVNTPACTLSKAGPFECKGNLEKDANFETIQQPLDEINAFGTNSLPLAGAKIARTFEIPYTPKITWFTAAEVSADSSIKPSEIGGDSETSTTGEVPDYKQTSADDYHWGTDGTYTTTSADEYHWGSSEEESIDTDTTETGTLEKITNETFGKDIFKAPGDGGVGDYIRSFFAPQIDWEVIPSFNATFYHCNGELGGAGNWDCPLWPVPDPEIVDIDSLTVNGSCQLKATPACINAINEAGLGGVLNSNFQFSDTFVKIVSAAGTRFGIPASALVTYLTRIGAIYKYSYYWSKNGEEILKDYSAPWYGTIGDCDDLDEGAVGPYDMLLVWFIQGVESEGGAALNEISQGRGTILNSVEVVPSRCNFLDSSYIAAAMITGGSGGGDCGSWDWNRVKAQLYTLAWGADRKGAYQNDPGLEKLQTVFEACR